ncbi:carboxylesterase/lipase family protein [Nonomuraea sp. NPDC050663]|uniref:carboxylesterase/lipase family protein n=1 Tax=Nonomuraea sp. NPDC050663 TaxID=3364370 RepID=UPI00379AF769
MTITLDVRTRSGRVRGLEVDDGVLAWRGLPYAAPPVGDLRLRPPQEPPSWEGVRDATRYGAPALQPPPAVPLPVPGGAEIPPASEDCLFLNVIAPAGGERRPVLVWFHGGGYQIGHGADMAGDGGAFVRRDGLVVVTVNYRLGALGFLAVEGERPTGAHGLHDQIAALRWVRDNIAAFGGDPGRVTVYGVSAGAKAVTNLLASPQAKGLFHRAASSSGGSFVATPEQAAAVAGRFLDVLGAKAGQVRQAPAEDLLAAQIATGDGLETTWLWRPMIDGVTLTGEPLAAIAAGSAAGVPLLVQTCVEECSLYQLLAPDAADQAERVLTGYFGPDRAGRVLAAYAAARPDLDPVRLRVEVMSDERYVIPTIRLADAQAAHAPVWRSRFDGPVRGFPGGPLPAMHGTDGTAIWSGAGGMGKRMSQAWAAFARTGNPGVEELPDWPAYDGGRRSTMIFDAAGPYVADDPLAEQRAAWDGLGWQPGTWWP